MGALIVIPGYHSAWGKSGFEFFAGKAAAYAFSFASSSASNFFR